MIGYDMEDEEVLDEEYGEMLDEEEELRLERIFRLIRAARAELKEALMSEGEWVEEKVRIALDILYELEEELKGMMYGDE